MLTIAARSKSDARCIAGELGVFDPELDRSTRAWAVTIGDDSNLVEILSALETCLGNHGIDTVTVGVNGRTYVMEPAPHRSLDALTPAPDTGVDGRVRLERERVVLCR
jgi:hypothetical protein